MNTVLAFLKGYRGVCVGGLYMAAKMGQGGAKCSQVVSNGFAKGSQLTTSSMATGGRVTVFLCGDVMLARGVDMIQRYKCEPTLYEGNGMSAEDYVTLTTRATGPLPPDDQRGIDYVWGDAIGVLKEKNPDVRIINLETSVTTSNKKWRGKGIHYRMHPKNVEVIKSADIDACVLSNNHTADWGLAGLVETLDTLKSAGMAYAGSGHDIREAVAPAILKHRSNGRVLLFAGGHPSSGIPPQWEADEGRCGVNVVDFSTTASSLAEQVAQYKRDGDIIIYSIHWGDNWGFEIDSQFENFAHKLIDAANVDIVHGHSSHHVKGVEIYKGKLILYGCGDFLNDYEGIGGHEQYRADLALMYFATVDTATGCLTDLTMVPTQIQHLRVNKACDKDVDWMFTTMARECKKFGGELVRIGNDLKLAIK